MNVGDLVQSNERSRWIGIVTNVTIQSDDPGWDIINVYVTLDRCWNKQRKCFISSKNRAHLTLLKSNNNKDWIEEVSKLLEK